MPAHKKHLQPVPRTCPVCAVEYLAHPVRLKHGRQTTCSRECSYALRRPKTAPRTTLHCVICAAVFVRTPDRLAHARHVRVCSRACHYAARRKGLSRRVVVKPYRSGRLHGQWLGGAHPYYGATWKAQRAAARVRDGGVCQDCGTTVAELGRALDVHHIIPRRMFADMVAANDLSNLVSLCSACHVRADAAFRRQVGRLVLMRATCKEQQ